MTTYRLILLPLLLWKYNRLRMALKEDLTPTEELCKIGRWRGIYFRIIMSAHIFLSFSCITPLLLSAFNLTFFSFSSRLRMSYSDNSFLMGQPQPLFNLFSSFQTQIKLKKKKPQIKFKLIRTTTEEILSAFGRWPQTKNNRALSPCQTTLGVAVTSVRLQLIAKGQNGSWPPSIDNFKFYSKVNRRAAMYSIERCSSVLHWGYWTAVIKLF